MAMRKLKKYVPTKFKAKKSVYDKDAADYAGDIAESVECTTIDDDRKVYCGGLKDSAEKELTIYYYDDDDDQRALIAAAEAQQTLSASVISGRTVPGQPTI